MVPTAVNLSLLTGVREPAGQIVPGADTATVAAGAEGATPAEGFDALMNSLLGALAPETAATTASLKTSPKSLAASPSEAAPAADTATVDTGLLALISGGAAPAAETLPADGKGLPPATAVAAAGAAKVAAADDPEPDGEDAEPLLAMLMQDGSVPAPSAAAGQTPSPAADGGTPAIPADTAATPAAMVNDGATALIPDTMPVAAPPQAAATPTSPPDPSATTVAAFSTPSSAPAPVAATTAASTATTPAVDAAASGDKTVEGHARTEQAPPQPARPDAPVPGATDNGATARDASSQNGNPQGGQTLLQEILAKIGGTDGAARGGDSFRALLQGADNGATANTGALVYTQPGAAAGSARDTAIPSLPVHTPLRHPEWSDEVSQRVRWVLGNQVQSAELKINPPQLGPIEVRVSVDSDQQMTVTLSSQHALVRETLQDSVPRLRDLMSEHGFSAVNVDVSQHSSSDGRKPAAQADRDAAMHTQADTGDTEQDTTSVRQHDVRGIVDFYA